MYAFDGFVLLVEEKGFVTVVLDEAFAIAEWAVDVAGETEVAGIYAGGLGADTAAFEVADVEAERINQRDFELAFKLLADVAGKGDRFLLVVAEQEAEKG